MEASTAQRRKGLEQKIPDISKTLDMVEMLKRRRDEPEPIETLYELNDTLYARAKLDPVERVHLWLGANVMLSYELDDAIELLREKLAGAKENLQHAKEDLGFLRDQITTMEVNTARVHNWDVKRRREKCVAAARADGADPAGASARRRTSRGRSTGPVEGQGARQLPLAAAAPAVAASCCASPPSHHLYSSQAARRKPRACLLYTSDAADE